MLLLGDSLAVNLAKAMPWVPRFAWVGANSPDLVYRFYHSQIPATGTMVVSLGANDLLGPGEHWDTLMSMFHSVDRTVWLIATSVTPESLHPLMKLETRGVSLIDTKPYVGPDTVHLSDDGAAMLARMIMSHEPIPKPDWAGIRMYSETLHRRSLVA